MQIRHEEALLRPRKTGLLVFAALSTLCGVGVHLLAEFAALGSSDVSLLFSARHIPLGLLSLGAVLALGCTALYARKRGSLYLEAMARELPGGGSGSRFILVASSAQFAVFGITEIAEGTPIGAGDIVLGTLAAACASALGAILLAFFHRRIVAAIGELLVVFLARRGPRSAAAWWRIDALVRVWRCRAITFSASRRPPPFALAND